MRASSLLSLTFIFTAAEYPLQIFGVNGKCPKPEQLKNYGNIPDNINYEENSSFRMPCTEGYLRKAGTSNLFRCKKNEALLEYSWNNTPVLECISDPKNPRPKADNSTKVAHTQAHTTAPHPTASTPSSTERPYFTTVGKTMDTSTTMNGQTSFTTTHTVATTAGTSQNTTLRTTTKEEEPMATTDSVTLSSSITLKDREILTTVSSQSTSSSNTSTTIPTIKSSTTVNTSTIIDTSTNTNTSATIPGASGHNRKSDNVAIAGGIAAGTVLMLIVVTGSAAGIFILCRRQDVSSTAVEMRQPPCLDHPLLGAATNPTSFTYSAQNPKSDPLIVVQ